MKHAVSGAVILLGILSAGLAGCAEHEASYEHSYVSGWSEEPRQTSHIKTGSITTGSLPAAAAAPAPEKQEGFQFTRDQLLRNERRVYAQGLEKILVSNGINVSVTVYEGQVGPAPTLMFFGHFTKDFVSRALTTGAVLQRARDLGFTSVDFFDRGPEGHYQFVLAKSAPLPKCAAYQRLCL
jgi:hypothetical protein